MAELSGGGSSSSSQPGQGGGQGGGDGENAATAATTGALIRVTVKTPKDKEEIVTGERVSVREVRPGGAAGGGAGEGGRRCGLPDPGPPLSLPPPQFKEEISRRFKAKQEQLVLIFAGKILKDGDSLLQHGVKDGLTVHLVIKTPQK